MEEETDVRADATLRAGEVDLGFEFEFESERECILKNCKGNKGMWMQVWQDTEVKCFCPRPPQKRLPKSCLFSVRNPTFEIAKTSSWISLSTVTSMLSPNSSRTRCSCVVYKVDEE